jgi:hypothetical protein
MTDKDGDTIPLGKLYHMDKRPSKDGETLSRGKKVRFDSNVKGKGKPGWYNEPFRHHLSALGIESGTKEKPKNERTHSRTVEPFEPIDYRSRQKGSGVSPYWEEEKNADIDILHDSYIGNLEYQMEETQRALEDESIDVVEYDRILTILNLAKNEIDESYKKNKNYETLEHLSEVNRSANDAIKDPRKLPTFYYLVGEPEKP